MTTKYHFIGIGGIGMSGLAKILLSKGIAVSGSDIAISPSIEELSRLGARIYKGHAAHQVPPAATVVYTSDVKSDNPELTAAQVMNLSLLHRADLLNALASEKKILAVAGTHGKTTTTSLLASVLMESGLDPSFAVGGIVATYQTNARNGSGEYFVLEADESDRSFLKFHPFGAILTNIDNDHLVNYSGQMQDLIRSFVQFATQVKSSNHLFWCCDDAYLPGLELKGESYGFHPHADWKITAAEQKDFNLHFDLTWKDKRFADIHVPLAGRHNILNATAVFALATSIGIPEEKIRHGFQSFKGALRRCEKKGHHQGVDFIDDYAHHPTEIQTTLEGIRKAIGERRLIAVFQPHRYTRVVDCLGSYGSIFDASDLLILTDIYSAGEAPIPGISHARIQEELAKTAKVAQHYAPRSALSHTLSDIVQPGDVVVTLGAGDITKLSHEALALLERKKGSA